jgi:RecA/RadA recombinase
MAKEKEEKKEMSWDQSILSDILKSNKADHFNFMKERYSRVSTSSFLMDHATGGGLTPGLHRFTGPSECGKTKAALDCMMNFMRAHTHGKGLYIAAEGRLPKEVEEKYGFQFVYQADEWEDGTCFVLQTNVYEVAAETLEKLVKMQSDNIFFIIIDSVDGLAPRDSFLKSYDESAKVAGGAVIASTLMKRISIPLGKLGHFAVFLSQERSYIKLDPYGPKEFRMSNSSGGNALIHYSNFIFNFEPRYKSDLIVENEKGEFNLANPILGHYAKVTIKKSPNEKTNLTIKYPVKYGRKVGTSVWVEKEIIDTLLMWEEIKRAGAWYEFSDESFAAVMAAGCEIKQKYQGLGNVYSAIENSECAAKALSEYIRVKLFDT